MNLSSLITAARNIALVTVVSLLVWVWAEGESLTDAQVSLRVELYNDPAQDLFVIASDGAGGLTTPSGTGPAAGGAGPVWSVDALVRLEGSTDIVTRAEAELDRANIRLSADTEGMPRQAGLGQTINLLDALRSRPELRRFSSALVSVEPDLLTVDVVRLITRDLPVRADAISVPGLETDGDPTPARPEVQIRLPEALAAKLTDASFARVSIDESEIPRLREEGVRTISVKVRPPAEVETAANASPALARLIAMRPETMPLTVRVRRSLETITRRSVPVWPSVAPDQFNKWEITLLDDALTDVVLTGPREGIERVQSGEWAVKATVELSWEDLERAAAEPSGIITKQAVIGSLPAGVAATVQNSTVRVRVRARESGPGGNGDEDPAPDALDGEIESSARTGPASGAAPARTADQPRQ